jgi:hypothetical protein
MPNNNSLEDLRSIPIRQEHLNYIQEKEGGLGHLSQEEKKVLDFAIDAFHAGDIKNAVIPEAIAKKINYFKDPASEKTTDDLFSKTIHQEKKTESQSPQSASNEAAEREENALNEILDKVNIENTKDVTRVEQTEADPAKRKDIADRITWEIMGKCSPVEGKEEIVIIGQVLGDGKGDWAAMRNQQKALQKMFPGRPVRIIANSAACWKGSLDISKKELEPTNLVFYGGAAVGGIHVPLEEFPVEDNVEEKVKQAGVVIESVISMGSTFSKDVVDQVKENSFKIFEHDSRTSSGKASHFSSTVLQMGLDPSKDLSTGDRQGIFISSRKKEYQWQDMSNTKLKSVLFEDNNPTQEQVDNYLSKHMCFFSYTSSPNQSCIPFVQDAFDFVKAHSKEKLTDICIPNLVGTREISDDLINDIKHIFMINDMPGVGSVKIIWYDGNQKKEHIILVGEGDNEGKGEELRLIDPGGFSAQDFKRMISLSAPIVGCTGDNSLAQTLSAGKVPSYEWRTQAKAAGLLSRIELHFGTESALYKYCNDAAFRLSTGSAALDGLAEQAEEFGEIIRKECSFKPILKGVVNERLLRQKDKDFAAKEDEIRQAYFDATISLEQFKTQLTNLLSTKGML